MKNTHMKQKSRLMIGSTDGQPSSQFAPIRRLATSWLLIQTLLFATPVLAQTAEDTPKQQETTEEAQNNAQFTKKGHQLSYSQLLTLIRQNEVSKVEIDPALRKANVTLKGDTDKDRPLSVPIFRDNPELIQQLRENNIPVSVNPSEDHSGTVG